jgi:hypothetical protein
VEAQAEQGVGPVVGPGDRRELVVDEPLLLLRSDRPVAEWNLFCRNAHGSIALSMKPNIAEARAKAKRV